MRILILFIASFPLFAHAIITSDCPDTLTITYGYVRAISDAELEKSAQFYDLEKLKSERDLIAKASPKDYQTLRLTRIETKNISQCRYLAAGAVELPQSGDNETRLMTRGGRDLIRVSLKIGGKYFWVYHNLAKYSTSGILIEKYEGAKIFGYFDHNSPNVHVGWANHPMLE